MPGKLIAPHRTGHVRSHEKGHEYWDGTIPAPQTDEERTRLERFLPKLKELNQKLKRNKLIKAYKEGEKNFSSVCASYRTFFGEDADRLIVEDLGDGVYRSTATYVDIDSEMDTSNK